MKIFTMYVRDILIYTQSNDTKMNRKGDKIKMNNFMTVILLIPIIV